MVLRATMRPTAGSRALKTLPMAPRPNSSTISYLPMTLGSPMVRIVPIRAAVFSSFAAQECQPPKRVYDIRFKPAGLGSLAVANDQQRQVVRLMLAPGKVAHSVEDGPLQVFDRLGIAARHDFGQSGDLEQFVVGILSFSNAIAEENERVIRLKLQTRRRELRLRNEANRERTLGVEFAHLTIPQEQ